MRIFPYKDRAIELGISCAQAEEILQQSTLDIRSDRYEGEDLSGKPFIGIVKDASFKLSMRSRQIQHFLPLMTGLMEDSEQGCVILVRYRLFGRAFFFIGLSICIGAFVGSAMLLAGEYFYSTMILTCLVLAYIISVANFNLQVNISHKMLTDILQEAAD